MAGFWLPRLRTSALLPLPPSVPSRDGHWEDHGKLRVGFTVGPSGHLSGAGHHTVTTSYAQGISATALGSFG